MRVTRVARPARCFDGGFKTRSPGAAKISLPGLQNGLLEVSAEIVAGRLCGPPSEAAREFPGGHFGVLLQRTLEACETMKHGSKINMFGAL